MMIVYKLTSPSGKCYIGITKRPLNIRISDHKHRAIKCHSHLKIHCAIRKYGINNFKIEILSEDGNSELEKYYIKKFDSIKNGYNISPGGEYGLYTGNPSMLGRNHTSKTKLKMSKSAKKVIHTEERIQKMSNSKAHWWKIITPEGEEKIIKNMAAFARDYDLSKGCLGKVASGQCKQHKGYICIRLENRLVK